MKEEQWEQLRQNSSKVKISGIPRTVGYWKTVPSLNHDINHSLRRKLKSACQMQLQEKKQRNWFQNLQLENFRPGMEKIQTPPIGAVFFSDEREPMYRKQIK